MDNELMLKLIINTLNDVEVKGKSNLDKLLGCINALEEMVKAEQDKKQFEIDKTSETEEK